MKYGPHIEGKIDVTVKELKDPMNGAKIVRCNGVPVAIDTKSGSNWPIAKTSKNKKNEKKASTLPYLLYTNKVKGKMKNIG